MVSSTRNAVPIAHRPCDSCMMALRVWKGTSAAWYLLNAGIIAGTSLAQALKLSPNGFRRNASSRAAIRS